MLYNSERARASARKSAARADYKTSPRNLRRRSQCAPAPVSPIGISQFEMRRRAFVINGQRHARRRRRAFVIAITQPDVAQPDQRAVITRIDGQGGFKFATATAVRPSRL